MEAVSSEVNTKARIFMSLAMTQIAKVGQNHIALAAGVDGSTVSRFMSEEKDMARALTIIAALGLKVVPAELQCFPPRKVQLLLELARDHLTQMESVDQLNWD